MKNKRKALGYFKGIDFKGGRVGVLLFHSLGGTPLEMRYLAQGLSRAGYTVQCPVIPGMTNGTDVMMLSGWRDWLEAAETALDEISKTCDTVYIGGLSAGSMLALRLAEKRSDEIAGNIVLAPTFWPNGWSIPWYFNFFRLVWQNWFARLFNFHQREPYGIKDERLRKFMKESFKADGRDLAKYYARHGQMVLQFRYLARKVRSVLHNVKHPTLVMHPREDDQSHLQNALEVQRRLGGPVEAYVLDDSYHMITLDRQRDFVLERTCDFLDRQVLALGISKDDAVAAQDVQADVAGLAHDDMVAAKAVAAE